MRVSMLVGVVGLFVALVMPTLAPAYAAVTTTTKNAPYDHSSTARYSSTGVLHCSPAQDTPTLHARECASAFTSNGQIDVAAESGLWQTDPLFEVETWAQGRINNLGDSPTTTCLSSDWFKFRDTYRWQGSAYREDGAGNSDGYLTHYFRIYRAADCNTWSGAFYQSFTGKLFQAGTPGVTTNFSGTQNIYTPVYGSLGGVSGKYSVRLEDTAVAFALNVPGAYGEANFWDGASTYNQIQQIKSYSCTTSLAECSSAT